MKLTERKLRGIIREELSKIKESAPGKLYTGYVSDRDVRDLKDAIRSKMGMDGISFKGVTKDKKEITVFGKPEEEARRKAQMVQRIADDRGIRLNLDVMDPDGGPLQPEKRTSPPHPLRY